MKKFTLFISRVLLFLIFQLVISNNSYSQEKEYVCFPCGADCDNQIHNIPGTCDVCNMDLIEKSRVKFKNLTPEKVAEILSSDNDIILLDVRTPEEFEGKGVFERFSHGQIFRHES